MITSGGSDDFGGLTRAVHRSAAAGSSARMFFDHLDDLEQSRPLMDAARTDRDTAGVASVLRPATAADAQPLSALARRSKAHWGYDAASLEAWAAQLTVQPHQCDGSHVVLAEVHSDLAGYYLLSQHEDEHGAGDLDHLFVDPAHIGSGLGGLLLRDALEQARRLGIAVLGLDSDPFAEGFYLAAGARRVGETLTADPTRSLPRLEFSLV